MLRLQQNRIASPLALELGLMSRLSRANWLADLYDAFLMTVAIGTDAGLFSRDLVTSKREGRYFESPPNNKHRQSTTNTKQPHPPTLLHPPLHLSSLHLRPDPIYLAFDLYIHSLYIPIS